MTALIRLEEISRVYLLGSHRVHALSNLTETISAGDYLAIMGPSGSGKSTLLNILGCLDRPTSGAYYFEEQNVATLSEIELSHLRRDKIGFVFQFFHLVPRLTASGNVELPMIFAGVPRSERKEKVTAALDAVGLSERVNHRPEQLSGGERQRVAIARATVMEPSLLLADEPTGNLDSASGYQVLELLERMNERGLTLVVVTHDPEIGGRAGRLIKLIDGRVAERKTGGGGEASEGPVRPGPGR